jgi:hypothetical protein
VSKRVGVAISYRLDANLVIEARRSLWQLNGVEQAEPRTLFVVWN